MLAGCGGGDRLTGDIATLDGDSPASPVPAATVEAAKEARDLAGRDKYLSAVAVLEEADMDTEADRMRRRGSRALYRSARRALDGGKYKTAHRLATDSRKLRKTAAARTVQTTANAKIAAAAAAERERRRLARIARDQRTCSSDEKHTVRDGAGTPAGCATYATALAAKRAEREAAQARRPARSATPTTRAPVSNRIPTTTTARAAAVTDPTTPGRCNRWATTRTTSTATATARHARRRDGSAE